MSTFCDIPPDELRQLLREKGFRPITLPGVKEEVYASRFTLGKMPVTVRVYTSLAANEVRAAGTDAIRTVVVGKDVHGIVRTISKAKRNYRVEGWKGNVLRTLEDWAMLVKWRCSQCKSPLTRRVETRKLWCSYCGAEKVM